MLKSLKILRISISVINLIGQLPTGLSSIEDLKKAQDQVTSIRNGASSIGDFFTSNVFDLKIKTSTVLSDIVPHSIVEGKKDIWVLRNCKLSTRSIILDMSNIVIMENIQILARSFTEPMFAGFNSPPSRLV